MGRLTLLLSLGIAALSGGTIDSGQVFTSPYFVSDDTSVVINFSSTDGNFSLFNNSGLLLGGANVTCIHEFIDCAFGTYSIRAFFPDAGSFPASASAAIGGIPVGTVLLGCPNPACPDTILLLTAQPVDISRPGYYEVPFSASGQIQASQSLGGPLLLDQTISGIGLLDFAVSTSSPRRFQFVDFGQREFQWRFQPVPEPSMLLPSLLGLAAVAWRRQRKNLS